MRSQNVLQLANLECWLHLSMDRDRRQSMRVSTRLPCQWQLFAEQPGADALRARFGISRSLALETDLARLGDDIDRSLRTVVDPEVRHVLALMNHKIDRLGHGLAGDEPPPVQSIVLSADGLELTSDQPCEAGSWFGIHLLLDTEFNFISAGQMSHCTQRGEVFQLGIVLKDTEAHSARRLARFVMHQSRRESMP